ncbi:hypothetical protein MKZ38_004312 [Zalerion maritima]|uniref:SH3 domain signaling protein n=1 Tax=Zalerion maritima TaxID=339359 RepID=A0AAD5WRQ7_9PEZI|nr:hypothetical protein MKZ38_004312 [Zalerion maritima]
MNAVSRQFTRMGISNQKNVRNPGDNARVSVMLNDFEDADKVLAAIVDNVKLWRDSWVQMLSTQHSTIAEFEKLYDPIVGASDGHGQNLEPTPELQLNRTFALRETYEELKSDLAAEISQIEVRVLQPAADARDLVAPIKKTIKKRENKRLDYEKATDKVLKLQRKMGKSPKEDAALAKAESDAERLQEDFAAADSHLRETLPPIIDATFSIVPLVIDAMVLVQNTLLGLCYTYLNRYCEQHEFPSPPPPMDEVVAVWSAACHPARQQVESITMIARGRGKSAPLHLTDEPTRPQPLSKSSTFSLKGGLRRTPTHPTVQEPREEEEEEEAPAKPPRPNRIPSTHSLSNASLAPRPSPSSHNGSDLIPDYSSPHGYVTPTAFTTATNLGQSSSHLSPNTGRPEYFSRRSSASTIASAASSGAAAAAKKKPPPPPPPKKKPQVPRVEYMVALYPFQGQSQGDLYFQEGDRIKIIERTETEQDWWVGELRGLKGNFPANYCRKE